MNLKKRTWVTRSLHLNACINNEHLLHKSIINVKSYSLMHAFIMEEEEKNHKYTIWALYMLKGQNSDWGRGKTGMLST